MGGSAYEARAVAGSAGPANLAGLGGTGRGNGAASWRLVEDGLGAPRAAWGPIVVSASARMGADERRGAATRAAEPGVARGDCGPARAGMSSRTATPGPAGAVPAAETPTAPRAPLPVGPADPQAAGAPAPSPALPRVRLRHACCSLRGRRRTNEDYVLEDLADPARPLFGVADGCGGEPLGDAMSRVACCAARRAWAGGASLHAALLHANENVLRAQALSEAPGAGTTLLLASVSPTGETGVCWAGDSQAFVARQNGGTVPLTRDDDRDAYGFLANVLGMRDARAHLARTRLAPGDRLLLATDGVWEPLGADAARILGAPGHGTGTSAAHDIARALCAAAVERGADNASAVVVVVEDAQAEACEGGRQDGRTGM